jgi:hypothetical protein
VLAALTISRRPEAYATWWAETADQAAISETVEAVSASAECEIEFALHSLMLDVFRPTPKGCRGCGWRAFDEASRSST